MARQGKPVNIKKGQFLAPWDMRHVVHKARATGNDQLLVCERGVCFGYNNLVSDMRALVILRDTGCPVVFDATHSVQLPGTGCPLRRPAGVRPQPRQGGGGGGHRRAVHGNPPRPDRALSDGPNAWPLGRMGELLEILLALDRTVKNAGWL